MKNLLKKFVLFIVIALCVYYVIIPLVFNMQADVVCNTKILDMRQSSDGAYSADIEYQECIRHSVDKTKEVVIWLSESGNNSKYKLFSIDSGTLQKHRYLLSDIKISWTGKRVLRITYPEILHVKYKKTEFRDVVIKYNKIDLRYEVDLRNKEKALKSILDLYPGINKKYKILGPEEVVLDTSVSDFARAGEKVWQIRFLDKEKNVYAWFFVHPVTNSVFVIKSPSK